jgi:hypothetical protein
VNQHTHYDRTDDRLYIRYPELHGAGGQVTSLIPAAPRKARQFPEWFYPTLSRAQVPLSLIESITAEIGKTFGGFKTPQVAKPLAVDPHQWRCPMCRHSFHADTKHVTCPKCQLSIMCRHGVIATGAIVTGEVAKRYNVRDNDIVWADATLLCAVCSNTARPPAKDIRTIEQATASSRTALQQVTVENPLVCPECSEPRPVHKGHYPSRWTCTQCHTELIGRAEYDGAIAKLYPESKGIVLDTQLTIITSRWLNATTKSRREWSIESLWTLNTPYGILTICGVCFGVAADHWNHNKMAGLKGLVAYIKTDECKHCGMALPPDYERTGKRVCQADPDPDGACKRRWLVRKATVPACATCNAIAGDIEVKSYELKPGPDGRILRCTEALAHWRATIAEMQAEGVTMMDVLQASADHDADTDMDDDLDPDDDPDGDDDNRITLPLEAIHSGGQTGADTGGLIAARQLGLNTGGMAPKGYRTELGPCPELADYGLTESPNTNYEHRTEHNILSTDATVIFGDATSPGSGMTRRLCKRHNKPCLIVAKDDLSTETIQTFQQWLLDHRVKVLNVAGNRESKNKGIGQFTVDFLLTALGGE